MDALVVGILQQSMIQVVLMLRMIVFTVSLFFPLAVWGQDGGEVIPADEVISVWPDAPPTWLAPQKPEGDTSKPDSNKIAGRSLIRLGNVSKPELHVYRPKENSSDTTILIAPGGGYTILAWDLEGTEIAQWLQGIGITAIVVKYRVPTRQSDTIWLASVQDIQRSLSLVRGGAIKNVGNKQVGVLGFSAGGNASARVATSTKRHYEVIDDNDSVDVRPDFAVLVYPAWLNEKDDPHKLIDQLPVDENTPPMFFAVAQDDRKFVTSSLTMFRVLNDHNVKAALHIFERGGHGFGGRMAGLPTDAWRGLCEAWMRDQGWLNQ